MIQVGDTVMLAFAMKCCGAPVRPATFTVQGIFRVDYRCECGVIHRNERCAIAARLNSYVATGEPLYRLIKLTGPDVDVSETNTEGLPCPEQSSS